ncbi:hypothetical protein DY000_02050082 [Brassica cretica]|uniref:CRM domain-containing protein n=1 Tax=Brassica cretica TaxID=69181 RepID=A0ABQ7ET37_BRACR|nr:hypothetical protein DY000_02050082 [Brassica cretica]
MKFRENIPTKFSLGIFRGDFRQTSDPRNFLGNLFPRNSVGKFRGISEERRNSEELFSRTCFVGIRGVFDGVIKNMHLHWKHRQLVTLISKQKSLVFVENTARLLEYESGGVLVAIENVPRGFALIYYRGKNYQRPISLRPRNLLTKAKALKRSIAMQYATP